MLKRHSKTLEKEVRNTPKSIYLNKTSVEWLTQGKKEAVNIMASEFPPGQQKRKHDLDKSNNIEWASLYTLATTCRLNMTY